MPGRPRESQLSAVRHEGMLGLPIVVIVIGGVWGAYLYRAEGARNAKAWFSRSLLTHKAEPPAGTPPPQDGGNFKAE